ncbi:MAG: hypothetical protein M1822_009188 [Bathelium mastoideum]|nr:MAG: hypothetical protein M1822_009188 [Bathelium mastoideum]
MAMRWLAVDCPVSGMEPRFYKPVASVCDIDDPRAYHLVCGTLGGWEYRLEKFSCKEDEMCVPYPWQEVMTSACLRDDEDKYELQVSKDFQNVQGMVCLNRTASVEKRDLAFEVVFTTDKDGRQILPREQLIWQISLTPVDENEKPLAEPTYCLVCYNLRTAILPPETASIEISVTFRHAGYSITMHSFVFGRN